MNVSFPIVLVLVVGSPVGAAPVVAPSSAPSSSVDEVRFEVDHSALLAQQMAAAAEDSAFFVREDGTKALRNRHGVDVVADEGAPAIVVVLGWKDYENSVYLIEVSTRQPGEDPQLVESFEATCINNSALTEVVLAKLPAALDQLAKLQEAAPPEPLAQDPSAEPGEPAVVEDANVDRRDRVPLGAMGKAGVGLLATGAVGVITGGIVFAQQQRFDENPSQEVWQGRDFGPPGVGVMVAGGVLAVTGAVLLITDRVKARRAREVAKPTAWLLPTTRGLAITGRF